MHVREKCFDIIIISINCISWHGADEYILAKFCAFIEKKGVLIEFSVSNVKDMKVQEILVNHKILTLPMT